MNISRRSFLGFLGAAGTLAVLPPAVRAAVEAIPNDEPVNFDGASAMALARYACDRLDWELGRRHFAAVNQASDWCSVDIEDARKDSPEAFKASVDAAISALKHEINGRRLNAFAALANPKGIEQCAGCTSPRNVSIRFMKAYDPMNAQWIMRFDVMGSKI